MVIINLKILNEVTTNSITVHTVHLRELYMHKDVARDLSAKNSDKYANILVHIININIKVPYVTGLSS